MRHLLVKKGFSIALLFSRDSSLVRECSANFRSFFSHFWWLFVKIIINHNFFCSELWFFVIWNTSLTFWRKILSEGNFQFLANFGRFSWVHIKYNIIIICIFTSLSCSQNFDFLLFGLEFTRLSISPVAMKNSSKVGLASTKTFFNGLLTLSCGGWGLFGLQPVFHLPLLEYNQQRLLKLDF